MPLVNALLVYKHARIPSQLPRVKQLIIARQPIIKMQYHSSTYIEKHVFRNFLNIEDGCRLYEYVLTDSLFHREGQSRQWRR